MLSRGVLDQAPTARDALNGSLRGRLYSDIFSSQASAARYRAGCVYLPGDVHQAPDVRDLSPGNIAQYPEGRGERMLRSDDD